MLKKLTSKSKKKANEPHSSAIASEVLGKDSPAPHPTASVVSDDGVQERDVHTFLDLAKEANWSKVEQWLEADYRRSRHINDTPGGRWSALHQAAYSGSERGAVLLLRYGADPTLQNSDGRTPADLASSHGDVRARLHRAAENWRRGRRDTLFGLLRIDPINQRGRHRDSALVAALRTDPGAASVQFPFPRYGSPMFPVFPAVRLCASADAAAALCDAHPPALAETTFNRWNLLHEACRWGAPVDALKLLIRRMPDAARASNAFGQTPLHLACGGGDASPEAIRVVAEAYPEAIDAKDGKGKTPLDVAEAFGAAPGVVEVLRRVANSNVGSQFYAKLMEDDDRNLNFKIAELVPLIEDTHCAVLFYTLVNSAYRTGGISSDDRSRYVANGLGVASQTTTCTDSIALFKLLLRKASDDGSLTDLEREKLDRESEVTHTSHAPFVQELREHIQSNSARIDGLEANVEALGKSLEKLKDGIRFQRRVEMACGLCGAVLNAVSFGVAGSVLSAATNATIASIVDFGDVAHIEAVVTSVGDLTVKEAFEEGISFAEDSAGSQLDRAAEERNPIVTIAYAAKVVEKGNLPRGTHHQSLPLSNDADADIISSAEEKPAPRLIDRVQYLEDQLSPGDVPPSILERVSCLEVQLFGSSQAEKGSLLERVAHLESQLGIGEGLKNDI